MSYPDYGRGECAAAICSISGELGNPIATQHLLDTDEVMIRYGNGRRLVLSNGAIASY